MPKTLNGGIIGCGFFAARHIEAWRRIPDVAIVAAADPDLDRARAFAPRAYRSAQEMLAGEALDFVDIVTRADLHFSLVQLAVDRKIPVICQKPLAPDWATAVAMVHSADAAGVPLMVHENWRWQPWYRVAHEMIRRGDIGSPIDYGFRSRAADGIGNEPYPRQPYFRRLQRFLIDEALVHPIDVASFLFGDIVSVYAQAGRRNQTIIGEDWAILTLTHEGSIHGWIDGHRFLDPQPDGPVAGDAFFEGEQGAISILPTGNVYRNGGLAWENHVIAGYRGDSVAATQAHFIACLNTGMPFETSGSRYLHTFAAVQAAYQSIAEQRCIPVARFSSASPGKSSEEATLQTQVVPPTPCENEDQ